ALGWASAEKLEELAPLVSLDAVVSLTSHVGALPAAAEVVIPIADIFEIEGSFINAQGIAQSFRGVLSAPADIEPGWQKIGELAKALGKDLGFTNLDGLRKGLSDAAEAAQ
ncbi:MAG: molybdopterin-dependent oxidoreductase, partial [Polyangiales bacterium]